MLTVNLKLLISLMFIINMGYINNKGEPLTVVR